MSSDICPQVIVDVVGIEDKTDMLANCCLMNKNLTDMLANCCLMNKNLTEICKIIFCFDTERRGPRFAPW